MGTFSPKHWMFFWQHKKSKQANRSFCHAVTLAQVVYQPVAAKFTHVSKVSVNPPLVNTDVWRTGTFKNLQLGACCQPPVHFLKEDTICSFLRHPVIMSLQLLTGHCSIWVAFVPSHTVMIFQSFTKSVSFRSLAGRVPLSTPSLPESSWAVQSQSGGQLHTFHATRPQPDLPSWNPLWMWQTHPIQGREGKWKVVSNSTFSQVMSLPPTGSSLTQSRQCWWMPTTRLVVKETFCTTPAQSQRGMEGKTSLDTSDTSS